MQRALKEIALEYDRKVHDVLLEAVDMVLQRYARPTVAELPDNVVTLWRCVGQPQYQRSTLRAASSHSGLTRSTAFSVE